MPNPLNKLEIIQAILDKIESGWMIIKPKYPGNIEFSFRFYHPVKCKEVMTEIPENLFRYNKLSELDKLVRDAVQHATVIS